ncbi:hypothetical protein [Alicyclobacillus acidoterrestris]|uniref:Uncharacterized protein n=1 Tax=Alicyclobacillus acidoterrestris (strain ATCC 49025 / DSM 3922 / CIP 106132 / NCIMB 13137 / GD3B) TaxID=1356854 RepID=T0C588_ALIAG|nr:hypothetical protein [Alicyclobacillus acidoterrestris]EPZ47715.1 hypothetical protein N007_05525 [Alicyclobacillus acidoterrestris ATCC 49025]UNO47973.1 hypothetical protein K1I37_14965 [Alicyclobacillus acidoterrestris]
MVPVFVKHVDDTKDVYEFAARENVHVRNILCRKAGYDVVYTLRGVGTYANIPVGHELYKGQEA